MKQSTRTPGGLTLCTALAQYSWKSRGFHTVASQQRRIRPNLRGVFNRHAFCSSI